MNASLPVPSLQLLGIKGTEDWFFGNMSRDRANDILLKEAVGVYLIRASSQPGSFALSVRDKERTNHYKIAATKRQAHEGYKFRIGSQDFPSMLQLIENYKKIKLVDSTLTVPATKPMYKAKYDFKVDPNAPDSEEDLPLKRNECVYFLGVHVDAKNVENPDWWRVQKRATGEIGYVPSTFLTEVTLGESEDNKFQALRLLNFPFDVEVMRQRNPNIFDSSQLRLEVGEIVEAQRLSDQQPEVWFGVVRGTQKQGLFPFTYVRPVPAGGPGRLASQSFSARSNRISQLSGPHRTASEDELAERL